MTKPKPNPQKPKPEPDPSKPKPRPSKSKPKPQLLTFKATNESIFNNYFFVHMLDIHVYSWLFTVYTLYSLLLTKYIHFCIFSSVHHLYISIVLLFTSSH